MTHDVTRPWVVTHDVSYVELSTQGNAHTHTITLATKKGCDSCATRVFKKRHRTDVSPGALFKHSRHTTVNPTEIRHTITPIDAYSSNRRIRLGDIDPRFRGFEPNPTVATIDVDTTSITHLRQTVGSLSHR